MHQYKSTRNDVSFKSFNINININKTRNDVSFKTFSTKYQQTKNDESFKSINANREQRVVQIIQYRILTNQKQRVVQIRMLKKFVTYQNTLQWYECLRKYFNVDTNSAITKISISKTIRTIKKIKETKRKKVWFCWKVRWQKTEIWARIESKLLIDRLNETCQNRSLLKTFAQSNCIYFCT